MSYDDLSEAELIEIVKDDPYAIEYIKNQSHVICIESLKLSQGRTLRFIKNQTRDLQLYALSLDSEIIKSIKNPSDELAEYAIRKNPSVFAWIKNPSYAIKLLAVTLFPENIKYIGKPSEELQFIAVKHDCELYKYFINNISENIIEYILPRNYHIIHVIGYDISEDRQLKMATSSFAIREILRFAKKPSRKIVNMFLENIDSSDNTEYDKSSNIMVARTLIENENIEDDVKVFLQMKLGSEIENFYSHLINELTRPI